MKKVRSNKLISTGRGVFCLKEKICNADFNPAVYEETMSEAELHTHIKILGLNINAAMVDIVCRSEAVKNFVSMGKNLF